MSRHAINIAVLVLVTCQALGCPSSQKQRSPDDGSVARTAQADQPGATANQAEADGGSEAAAGRETGSPAVPEGWPEFLPVYPGGRLMLGGSQTENGRQRQWVGFAAEQDCATISAYYEERALANGFEVHDVLLVGDSCVKTYKTTGEILTVDVSPNGDVTTVYLEIAQYLAHELGPGTIAYFQQPDLPPGFPRELLKPLPDAAIEDAVITVDRVVLGQQTAREPAEALQFYSSHFAELGWDQGDTHQIGKDVLAYFSGEDGEVTLTTQKLDEDHVLVTLEFAPITKASVDG